MNGAISPQQSQFFSNLREESNTMSKKDNAFIANYIKKPLEQFQREELEYQQQVVDTSMIANQIKSAKESIEYLTHSKPGSKAFYKRIVRYIIATIQLENSGTWTDKNTKQLKIGPVGRYKDNQHIPVEPTYLLGRHIMTNRGCFKEGKYKACSKFIITKSTNWSIKKLRKLLNGFSSLLVVVKTYIRKTVQTDENFEKLRNLFTWIDNPKGLLDSQLKKSTAIKNNQNDFEEYKDKKSKLHSKISYKSCLTKLIKNKYDNFEEKMIKYTVKISILEEEIKNHPYKGYIKLPFFN